MENKQAIEMTGIYRDIINGTRELLSSVIDNRMNSIMKSPNRSDIAVDVTQAAWNVKHGLHSKAVNLNKSCLDDISHTSTT